MEVGILGRFLKIAHSFGYTALVLVICSLPIVLYCLAADLATGRRPVRDTTLLFAFGFFASGLSLHFGGGNFSSNSNRGKRRGLLESMRVDRLGRAFIWALLATLAFVQYLRLRP